MAGTYSGFYPQFKQKNKYKRQRVIKMGDKIELNETVCLPCDLAIEKQRLKLIFSKCIALFQLIKHLYAN